MLKTVEKQSKTEIRENPDSKESFEINYCPNCGKKIEKKTIICSSCGIDID
ncbi:MAG TPA: zinc-ribbon domain-containing protein [archaeon]|nr:zinc-ribbon domain-containing protein [archaeon]